MYPDPSPKYRDSDNTLLFKIAQMLAGGVTPLPGSAVNSFNSRTGVVTLTSGDVTGALGFTPAVAGSGVTSFNTRTGAVTLLSADVTTALGFTPLSQAAGDVRYVLKSGDSMTGLLSINTAVTSLRTIVTDAGTTNAPFVFELYHRSSGTPAAGFGNRIQFYANSDTVADQFQTRIDSQWVDATDATRSSQLVFGTRTSGGVISSPLILRGAQTTLLDATAAAPSLTFQNDLDTGMYRIGANSLGFSTGGVLRLTVDGTSTTSVGTFLIPDGTVALPGLAFAADTNTGIYRIGADNFGLSAGGALTLAIATTGVNMTAGLAYQYNGSNVVRAQTALDNYFFGPSGNLTMTGIRNSASGSGAFQANTTGALNVAFGYQALFSNTDGANMAAIGYQALLSNTTGIDNVALGYQALRSNTTGNDNQATGFEALFSNTTGSNSVAMGNRALRTATTGGSNVGVGFQAFFDVTTGTQNTAVGYNTGRGITTGSNNTILGANVTGLAAGLSNNIILADGAGNQRINVDSSGNTTLAGTAATADGTAALPAKTFSADTDTGFYRIGANSIGTTTNGVLRITTNATDVILAAGFRLAMASGANQRAGNATLVAGTVTVANTSVTANTIVLLTRKTSGGTIGTAITYSVIAATSFTIQSDSIIDTSVFSYLLIEVP